MFRCIRTPLYITFFWWIYIACDLAEIFLCCLWIVPYWVVHYRILLLLFLHLCCVCMKQNPSGSFLHFYGVPCTIFLLLVLNCRYGKTGMACPLLYTFLTSKPVSGKKWETTDFYCDSIAATLTSLLPARREVQDKSWLRLTWEEKFKRKTFWVTHFLMGPIDYVSGIDLLVSILTKWIMNFSRRLSFWTKTSS